MFKKMNKTILLAGVLALVTAGSAYAEPYGLLNGRRADLGLAPEKSFEAGAVFGEFNEIDYEHFGARFNFKLNPTTVIYGDAGQSAQEFNGDADGLTFGLGAFWQMDGMFASADFAVHASFHRIELDFDNFDNGIEGNSIMVEGVFSSKNPINVAGTMFFNGSIGLNRLSLKATDVGDETDTETELTFSGGVVAQTQTKAGEFYAGVIYVEDLGFGAGYRHFLK